MTRWEYARIAADAILDYGKACRTGTLTEQADALEFLFEVIKDREDFHEREAELHSSRLGRGA